VYDPFDLSDAVIRDLPHVRVTRHAPRKGRRCEYRKVFKKTETFDGHYWIRRECDFLQYFSLKRTRHVVEYSKLHQGDEAATKIVEAIATYDAGVTILDWLNVRPKYPDGSVLAHPFAHAGMFLLLLKFCLAALREIHTLGIVHCDIKADNLCLPCEPYPYRKGQPLRIGFKDIRLIDFAFAILPELPLRRPIPVGTTDYHSARFREAVRDDAAGAAGSGFRAEKLDFRDDLYSLGVMARKIRDRAGLIQPPGEGGFAALIEANRRVEWLLGFDTADWPENGELPHGQAIAEINVVLAGLSDLETCRSFEVAGFSGEKSGSPTPLADEDEEDEEEEGREAGEPEEPVREKSAPVPRNKRFRRKVAAALLGVGAAVAVAGLVIKGDVPASPEIPLPEMVHIPAGSFEMGCGPGEAACSNDEKPRHKVKVAAFRLGKYEVTQGQWKAVMGSNPSGFKDCGDDCPVESVSYNDVQEFIRKLNAKTGKTYRLPTEAEWEYAARAGTTTAYWWGDTISHDYANYGKDECCGGLAQGRDRWVNTAPVGSFPANPRGLHDLHGNVWEWTADCWHENYRNAPTEGSAWLKAEGGDCGRRVVRGGAWSYIPYGLRSASRYGGDPAARGSDLGVRLAQD
jgi:formylglycine-generating enzyme required for sulfatase activity